MVKIFILTCVCLLELLCLSYGQIIQDGQCDPNINLEPEFNLEQFLGNWYEIAKTENLYQNGDCSTTNLEQIDDIIWVQNVVINDNFYGEINGTATLETGTAKLQLDLPISSDPVDFWVLMTDYTTYAVTYKCVDIGTTQRSIYIWVLARQTSVTEMTLAYINIQLGNLFSISTNDLYFIDHSENACHILPEIEEGEPIVIPGSCDTNSTIMQDFDITRFSGIWHEFATYESENPEASCQRTEFIVTNDNVNVLKSYVTNQALNTVPGQVTIDSDGKLTIVLENGIEQELWILATDYQEYAVSYYCEELPNNQKRVLSWIHGRSRQFSPSAQAAVNDVIDSMIDLNVRYYQETNRTDDDCFYYPEPAPGEVVVFRGQCDENIDVVQSFDLERYSGIWYNIESYPEDIENGTCSAARYEFTDDFLEVYNTQVINEQLASYNGSAVFGADDGSAKLTLSLPGATLPYWVLATDYENYALVYSCINVDEEHRRVHSWKLSRARSLDPDSVVAIENEINKVPVLRQQYYETSGHTDDDCFYYPDNFGGPVILKGQCEDNEFEVINDFNVSEFAGTWHEVARFPSGLQTGECAASEYTVTSDSNSFNIVKTIINDERLVTLVGIGIVSDDGRGIISTDFTDEGEDLTLHILDTDYNEYALLLSCRNIGNDTKQIYSWKLSKSQSELSSSANDTINELVSKTKDLFENYYENTDQSNDACFYYPVFDEMPPFIELPGSCDERIQAKANFDVGAYTGRWFEIAKYPQPFQVGECVRAHYNPGNENIEVINTIVYNRTLESIVGSAEVVSNDGSGLLNVTFVLENGVVNVASLYVLETDYTNFALVYSCRDLDNGNRQVSSWKLSRQATLSSESNTIINNIITNTRGLLEDYYTTTSQTKEDCFYIPELDLSETVVFRGQCEDITGVQGFDIQRYLGVWREIERYSSGTNFGECITARYQSIGDEYVVVDSNIYGVVAIINNDTLQATNDGRLIRTLSDGQVIETLILATDYETYSLLYSCENIDSEYRRVWSAKHSRTRELSQEAESAITSIVESNQVLYPHLYVPVGHSDDACFHYPEQTGDQIILPGQCDLDIPVVEDFDFFHYTGTWYQIERYPRPDENGTCVGVRYTLNEQQDGLDVLSWDYSNGTLNAIEGIATNASDGKMTVTLMLPDSDEQVTTEMYILATDYVSYSLTYTCVNVDEEHRAVGVWKYSRQRTMPNSGTTAINVYMAQREELHQPYFVQVEHDDSCEDPNTALLLQSSIIIIFVCLIVQLL